MAIRTKPTNGNMVLRGRCGIRCGVVDFSAEETDDTGVPQTGQNLAFSSSFAPHLRQNGIDKPHFMIVCFRNLRVCH